MNETKKRISNPSLIRIYDEYCTGKGIDIGSGETTPIPNAYAYDWKANRFHNAETLPGIPTSSYDFVHSSHCLEHMSNPYTALYRWWEILKPGGHMILAVPCLALYEQFQWPPVYCKDHISTFSLGNHKFPNHYSICDLVEVLPGAQIRECHTLDIGFDYSPVRYDRTLGAGMAELLVIVRKMDNSFFTKDAY